MAQGKFAATVGAWAAKTKERQVAVYHESAQRIVAIMQTTDDEGGNLNFDTGFLRASLMANTTDTLPEITFKPDGVDQFPYDAEAINQTISDATITEPITVVYTAKYARRMEYGFTGEDSLGRTYAQSGSRFVALAAQQWQQVVAEVAAEAQSRTEG